MPNLIKRAAASLFLGVIITLILTLLLSVSSYSQGISVVPPGQVISGFGRPISGAKVAVCQPLATTGAAVTSNVAILTMSSNPVTAGFATGGTLTVGGFTGGDTYLNGTGLPVLSVTPTTIAYSIVHANATAGTNGTALQLGNANLSCGGLSTVYTDLALTVPKTNPFTTDGLGNYQFFVATPGTYYVQTYGPGITTSLAVTTAATSISNIIVVSNLNGYLFVDGVRFTTTDLGAGINAAIAALPTNGGYKSGVVILGPGTYTQSTQVSVTSPYVTVKTFGGSGATQITCTLNTICWNITTSPFTIIKAGTIGGFLLLGQSANANAIGMQLGGINNIHLQDLEIKGFSGSSAIGMLWNNPTSTWSERTIMNNVWLNLNKTDLKITDTNSAVDFSYWDIQRLEINTLDTGSGTGVDLENDVEMTGGDWNVVVNTNTPPAATTNVFLINGTSVFGANPDNSQNGGLNRVHITVDNSGLTNPVTLWNVGASAISNVAGDILGTDSTVYTNTISGIFINWISATYPGSSVANATDLGIVTHQMNGNPANKYTLRYMNPASARVLSVIDPGADASYSFNTIYACGATSGTTQACAGTVEGLGKVVFGDVTLNTATTQIITALPFTASGDYSCSGSDLTTPAGVVAFPTYTSGAQVTIQETSGTTADHLRYMCIGF